MVATKLTKVTAKGMDWAYQQSTASNQSASASASAPSPPMVPDISNTAPTTTTTTTTAAKISTGPSKSVTIAVDGAASGYDRTPKVSNSSSGIRGILRGSGKNQHSENIDPLRLPASASSTAVMASGGAPNNSGADEDNYYNYYWNHYETYWNQATNAVSGAISSLYSNANNNDTAPASTPSPTGRQRQHDASSSNLPDTVDSQHNQRRRRSRHSSIMFDPDKNPMHWMFRHRNPYTSVQGRHYLASSAPPQSLDAIRSLLTLVPTTNDTHTDPTDDENSTMAPASSLVIPAAAPTNLLQLSDKDSPSLSEDHHYSTIHKNHDSSPHLDHNAPSPSSPSPRLPSETASQLSEGTLRALRDLALDEAWELHRSLNHWTFRWEHPGWSWLEAGPTIWWRRSTNSPSNPATAGQQQPKPRSFLQSHGIPSDPDHRRGYDHRWVGHRVSQIQAVLARRCATIGELQQHLWRAGWQKGVAQWGVLGQGGPWAVAVLANPKEHYGEGGRNRTAANFPTKQLEQQQQRGGGGEGGIVEKVNQPELTREPSQEFHDLAILQSPRVVGKPVLRHDDSSIRMMSTVATTNNCMDNSESGGVDYYYGHSHVVVNAQDGGKIERDDPALAAWSVDAIRLVRRQLYRASNGKIPLPFVENWTDDQQQPSQPLSIDDDASEAPTAVKLTPKWVSLKINASTGNEELEITNIPLMAKEVETLLDTMEVIMQLQRERRLEQLKPMPWWRRNWYVIAVGGPAVVYGLYKLVRNDYGRPVARLIADKAFEFYHEHVSGPLAAIFTELFTRTRRYQIVDHEARLDAIQSLKNMIHSWLTETFPEMSESERQTRADRMDMSLIETKKGESMKTIFEINSVVRMSLIEMQFIKKEMLNAMYAMDEMMTSNEINMNLAAVTPAVLFMYGVRVISRYFYYFLLRLGKSKEETYASFRHILLDVERLLVMRDRPAAPPSPLDTSGSGSGRMAMQPQDHVLSSDDLGMLMLHIHGCRTILWQDRRRFSPQIQRDVSEDLAELAGERGIVSVRQQLQILARMYRTYPFMKVVSTGIPFDLVIGRKAT